MARTGHQNIQTQNSEKFDSALTFHGVPRKRQYPKNRKPRSLDSYNTRRTQKTPRMVKAAQETLLTYAPLYSTIYTISFGFSEAKKFCYVDFLIVSNDKLYKISALAGKILHVRMLRSNRFWRASQLCQIPHNKNPENLGKEFLDIEQEAVAALSQAMFNRPDGYFWESILHLHAFDTPKPVKKKSYIVRESDIDKKSWRV